MLLGITQQMDHRMDACTYDLISIYPRQDQAEVCPPGVRVIPGRPLTMICILLPLTIILSSTVGKKTAGRLLRWLPAADAMLKADVVVDCSGISFVDGRGLAKLIYNVSLCLPPLLLGTPLVKLAQTLGPFNFRLNRLFAEAILPRLDRIIARGDVTAEHLAELGCTNYEIGADVAFLMEVSAVDMSSAKALLPDIPRGCKVLGLSPSVVTEAQCGARGLDYRTMMADLVAYAISKDFKVVMIPHAVRPESRLRRNNDLILCREILDFKGCNAGVCLVESKPRAPVLRALISRMDVVVVSRFHAAISALSTGVPLLTIGGGHKYREAMSMFGLEAYHVGIDELSSKDILQKFETLTSSQSQVREEIVSDLVAVKGAAVRNVDTLVDLLQAQSRQEFTDEATVPHDE